MQVPAWLALDGTLLFLGAIFGLPWLVVFSLALGLILGIGTWWKRQALEKVTYRRMWHYRRLFPGETTDVRIEVENNKLVPISWLRASDPWPTAVAPVNKEILAPTHIQNLGMLINLYSLRWNERIKRQYSLLFSQRGLYGIGPTTLESGDIFGLFETNQELNNEEFLTVFPEILTLKSLHLTTEDPFGDLQSRRRLFEDPNRPMGVRPYHPEDEFRRIHWPATARTGSLQVKVYQPVTAQVMVICLNITTAAQAWLGIEVDLVEHLIKVAATLCYHSVMDGYAVGLMSNGCLAHADHPFNIPPGRNPDQLGTLLQSLAAVTTFTTAPFEEFLVKSIPKVPFGATLVIISSVLTPQLTDALMLIKRYRHHTTLVSLATEPAPDIPGIRIHHLPYLPNTNDQK